MIINPPMKPVNIILSEKHIRTVDELAANYGVTRSDMIRRLIDGEYERYMEKKRLEGRQFGGGWV